MVRIVGLDPGLRITGWGIIEKDGTNIRYIAHGRVASIESTFLAERLQSIYQGLEDIMKQFSPEEAAVEETFVNMNPRSTLKLGMARGVVLLAPALHKIPVYEYTPTQVKKSVVGAGRADKNQISFMVQRLLPRCGPVSLDAADALAVALCHAHHQAFLHKTSGLGKAR